MRVQPIPPDEADPDARRIYDADLDVDGYISNTTRLFSLNPAAYEATWVLRDAIRAQIDDRRYELATFAASRALRSRVCLSAHGENLMRLHGFDRSQVEAMTVDFRSAGLDATEVAVMSFAEKIALDASAVTADDVEEIRRHGLSDRDIFAVVLTAAFRAFYSKCLDAMGCEPDEQLASTSHLAGMVALNGLEPGC